jgi:putative transposase
MARRPPRVSGFDYRGLHRYFITICTHDRRPYLTAGDEARELSTRITSLFGAWQFNVVAYCIMPDHVHLLLEGVTDDADLREAMRRWKLRTGYDWRRRHETPLWQTSYQDRVLREHDDIRAVVRYVLNNPVRAGLVRDATEYAWSGSSRHSIAELAEYAGDWNPVWK